MTHLAIAILSTQLLAPSGDLLLKTGQPAPPFSMRDVDRQMWSLANHTGAAPKEPKKAVMLSFFATWCKPCMKEIPILRRLHAAWKNVEIIYVGQSQKAAELKPFLDKEKIPWRTVPDSFGLLSRRYGASQLPHLVIVDKSGRVAWQHQGIAPELESTLNKELSRITGEPIPAGGKTAAAGTTAAAERFSKTYTFGRVPASPGAATRWQPLAAYVGEQVSATINAESADSYAGFESAVKSGKFDLVNAGPRLCNAVKKVYEPVARVERQDSATYLGIIFVKRDSPVQAVADLKGKTIGLVDAGSSSGGLYQQKALLDGGLVPGKDVTVKWLGSHDKVARAVKAGTVDAGGCFEDCRDSVWMSVKAKAAATRVVAYTDEIPGEMILVKKKLPKKERAALKKAVLSLNDAAAVLAQISQGELTVTGVFDASIKDLNGVSNVVSAVKKNRAKK